MSVLERLAAALRAEGGLLAAAAVTPPGGVPTPHGDAAGAARAYAVEAIREGHLLHGGAARVLRTDDPDLALLAGDRLYALGLAELAAAGDLPAVEAMADVIARAAAARAAGDEAGAERAWEEGVQALGARGHHGDR